MTIDRDYNPLGNVYESILKIIKNIVIKYTYFAEQQETERSKHDADEYISAIRKTDNFSMYNDYTMKEVLQSGINDSTLAAKIVRDASLCPNANQENLLNIRRKRVIDTFVEKNNYFRTLNGLPDLNDTKFYYSPEEFVQKYGIDKSIPIHELRKYYNSIDSGRGDYIISLLEGSLYLDNLIKAHPDKPYLKYIGSNQVRLDIARKAKNFQILLAVKPADVSDSLFETFLNIYEDCRSYFVSCIYNTNFHSFFDYYDNFIAMCITLMTCLQIVDKQELSIIDRNFFDLNGVRALYEAYDVPFDIDIDERTQNQLTRNLNLLIQRKATDKVLFNIAYLLGYTNIDIYKYYLAKVHKYDPYGAPIFAYKKVFNTDTGEEETVFDYEKMYDLHFLKVKLNEDNYYEVVNKTENIANYEDVTSDDPFWHNDFHVFDKLWNTEFNYVESKYLSFGISYSLTEILYDNIMLLKLIFQKRDELEGASVQLPRITGDDSVIPLFDTIVLLLCLTAANHYLYGEIITIPTQVISVLDYLKNKENPDLNLDTLKFNYNYFFNPDETEDKEKMDEMKEQLIQHMRNLSKSSDPEDEEKKEDLLGNTFGFNFDYFSLENEKREEHLKEIQKILGEKDYELFKKYVNTLSYPIGGAFDQKIKAINDLMTSIKGMQRLLRYYMLNTNDRKTYETLKNLSDSIFYSKEVSDVFTITGSITGIKRTAFTYFEYLHWINPKLYNKIFYFDKKESYKEYIRKEGIDPEIFTLNDYLIEIEKGNIFVDYSKLLEDIDESKKNVRGDKIYFYVTHIIGRLAMRINNLDFMYLMVDTSTPLEKLLMKLVRHFKSLTVDMLNLDILIVLDVKPDLTIRLFDEIYKIEKTIEGKDSIHVNHSDIIKSLVKNFTTEDFLLFKDHLLYTVNFWLEDKIGVRLNDYINEIMKSIDVRENIYFSIGSVIHKIEETLWLKDRITLSEYFKETDKNSTIEKKLSFWEHVLIDSYLYINRYSGEYQSFSFFDKLYALISNLLLKEENSILVLKELLTLEVSLLLSDKLYFMNSIALPDKVNTIEKNIQSNENIKFTDSVYKLWYSD